MVMVMVSVMVTVSPNPNHNGFGLWTLGIANPGNSITESWERKGWKGECYAERNHCVVVCPSTRIDCWHTLA